MIVQSLSSYQRRVWLLEQAQPRTPANLLSISTIIDTRDLARWRGDLRAVVARHEMLHSYYGVFGNGPGRIATDAGRTELPVLDLHYLPQDERDEALRQVLARHARTSFDLSQELPVRALLILLPGSEVFVLTVHKIALDESALGPLLREILADREPGHAAVASRQVRATEANAGHDDIGYWQACVTYQWRRCQLTRVGKRLSGILPTRFR